MSFMPICSVNFVLSLRDVRDIRRWKRKLNYVNDVLF